MTVILCILAMPILYCAVTIGISAIAMRGNPYATSKAGRP